LDYEFNSGSGLIPLGSSFSITSFLLCPTLWACFWLGFVASGSRFGSRSREKSIELRRRAEAGFAQPLDDIGRIDETNSGGAIQHSERAGHTQPNFHSSGRCRPRASSRSIQVCFHTDGESNGFHLAPIQADKDGLDVDGPPDTGHDSRRPRGVRFS
jgi:hypothetical protein